MAWQKCTSNSYSQTRSPFAEINVVRLLGYGGYYALKIFAEKQNHRCWYLLLTSSFGWSKSWKMAKYTIHNNPATWKYPTSYRKCIKNGHPGAWFGSSFTFSVFSRLSNIRISSYLLRSCNNEHEVQIWPNWFQSKYISLYHREYTKLPGRQRRKIYNLLVLVDIG